MFKYKLCGYKNNAKLYFFKKNLRMKRGIPQNENAMRRVQKITTTPNTGGKHPSQQVKQKQNSTFRLDAFFPVPNVLFSFFVCLLKV